MSDSSFMVTPIFTYANYITFAKHFDSKRHKNHKGYRLEIGLLQIKKRNKITSEQYNIKNKQLWMINFEKDIKNQRAKRTIYTRINNDKIRKQRYKRCMKIFVTINRCYTK